MVDRIHQFYNSKDWRDLAYKLKIERGCRCAKCGKILVDFSKLIGHHKVEMTEDNVDDVRISLNPDLIEIICLDCHNEEHVRFGTAKKVFIIWGSPMSGKTTLVRQLVRRGDMVLDLDALWQAISFRPMYDKPDRLRFNIFAVRDNLLEQIKTRHGQWGCAYIIGGYPDRGERESLARLLGAEAIYCDSTRGECIERAGKERPAAWVQYVNDWWDVHERHNP